MKDQLKKLGATFMKVTGMIAAVLAYITVLLLPAVLFPDEAVLMGLWVFIAIAATMYGAIWHAIANEKDRTLPYLQRLKESVHEATKKFFLGAAIFVGIVMMGGWSQSEEEPEPVSIPTSTYRAAPSTYTVPSTFSAPIQIRTVPVHYDDSYEYNYRTGYSGDYEYNYDIEGYSDSGDYFYGEVDTSGKYGEGYIYDDYGNEIYVETEWVDYGVMEATDEYGNSYEFEVD